MPKAQRSLDSRGKLLAAAETVILEQGVTHLTLDAVATAAGISKGGLLYHFVSKEALIVALVESIVCRIEADLDQAYAAEPAGAGRATRAMIVEWANSTGRGHDDRRDAVGAALLAASGSNPELLAPLQRAFSKWMKELGDDGLPPGVSLTVAAAIDGLTFWHLFGLYRPSKTALRDTLAFLQKLTSTKA